MRSCRLDRPEESARIPESPDPRFPESPGRPRGFGESHTFAPGEIKSATVGTYAFSTSQVTGYWGIGSGGALTVTLTSWDKRKRRLTGTFEGTMHDAATFLVLPDLHITDGDFGVVIPKPRK